MNNVPIALLCTLGLFAAILLLLNMGWRMGVRRAARLGDNSIAGMGAIDGAVFGLLGLLLAFTFSDAASRFDGRRQLIVEEANDIGTAYLRLDLLPASTQPALRESFRDYVDSRLSVYKKLPDIAAARQELVHVAQLQDEIWTQAVTACRAADSTAPTMLLLPAINQMIDIATTRTVAAESHPPLVVFAMLITLTLVGASLAGYGMAAGKYRDWVHMLGFAIVMSASVYVIIDFEFPRLGLIRVDAFDHLLVDLRESMK
jgi:hypothetical protein